MLLSFVCVKNQWSVCCRWIRAAADACFVQSVKPPYIGVKIKRTSNSYDISRFWIYLRLTNVWEHMKSLAENMWIQQKWSPKFTMTLSINNSNKDFDFVCWVIKTPWLTYFRSLKSHCVKETHRCKERFGVGENCCNISAQKTSKKIFVKIFDNWKHRLGLES